MKPDIDLYDIAMAAMSPMAARTLVGAINDESPVIVLYQGFILSFICVSLIYLFMWLPFVYHNYFDGNVSGDAT